MCGGAHGGPRPWLIGRLCPVFPLSLPLVSKISISPVPPIPQYPPTLHAPPTQQVPDELSAAAAFAGVKAFVQNGDFTRSLKNLGYSDLRVTGLEGGPKNGPQGAVNMPAPAACNALNCANCASTPNCGWCTTSNKCLAGDRDPDQACIAADGKTDLFQHWVYVRSGEEERIYSVFCVCVLCVVSCGVHI